MFKKNMYQISKKLTEIWYPAMEPLLSQRMQIVGSSGVQSVRKSLLSLVSEGVTQP